jgi:hypothetical protein
MDTTNQKITFDDDREKREWKERVECGMRLSWDEYKRVKKEAISNRKKRIATSKFNRKNRKKSAASKGSGCKIIPQGCKDVDGEQRSSQKKEWEFMKWNKTAEKLSKRWKPTY